MMIVFLKIDRVAKTVRELAVLENLEQNVKKVGMRFLDFVQQNDGVGSAFDALGQLSALFIADISGRRTDQLRNRVLLMYSDMSKRTSDFSFAKGIAPARGRLRSSRRRSAPRTGTSPRAARLILSLPGNGESLGPRLKLPFPG